MLRMILLLLGEITEHGDVVKVPRTDLSGSVRDLRKFIAPGQVRFPNSLAPDRDKIPLSP